jgi:DsbC/DsbD-like thiol-disulfide interchange protein
MRYLLKTLARPPIFLLALAAVFGSLPVANAAGDEERFLNLVTAELRLSVSAATPGDTISAGVLFEVKPGWHIYWMNPGDSGLPTVVSWKFPEGVTVSPTRYPAPIKFMQPGAITGYGYEDLLLLSSKVQLPTSLTVGAAVPFSATVRWLACADVCVPGKSELTGSIPIAHQTVPTHAELFKVWNGRVPARAKLSPIAEDDAVPFTAQVRRAPGSTPGSILVTLALDWGIEPRGLDWFPAGYKTATVEQIKVTNSGKSSEVTFLVTPQTSDLKELESLLVFDDLSDTGGRRSAVSLFIPLQ